MAIETNTTPSTEIELTLEEQWAAHHALLEYAEVAAREDTELPDPVVELSIVDTIEQGVFEFTGFELERLQSLMRSHAESAHTPDRDREPSRSVVRKIDSQCPTELGQ